MNSIHFHHLNETLYYGKLHNGLRVYLLPKPDYHKTYAAFTTQFGSIDNHFEIEGGREFIVPDGVAHFLEHKMFEKKDGDVFHRFSISGASANAFTTFDRTAYLFSSTENVYENLNLLLDFVQEPYFSEQTVEKEKGIIAQEIRMYDDNPDFKAFFNLLKGMFHHHTVRNYIAGTVDSIAEISAEMLYTCYKQFYHPANMILFVVGAIEPYQTMNWVERNQAGKRFDPYEEVQRYYPFEPEEINQPVVEEKMPVGINKCLIGFKDREYGISGESLLKKELYTRILLDAFVGKSSALYQALYEEGLIGEDFGSEYSGEVMYGYSVIGGDTPNPDRFIERIREGVLSFREQGIADEQFERSRRKLIGEFLRSLNSLEYIANQFTRYQFNEIDFLSIYDLMQDLTVDETNQRLLEHLDLKQMVVSVVRSK